MGITSLMKSLLLSILLFPCFTILIIVIRCILQLAAPFFRLLARNHFTWLPDSPFLDRSMSSLCDVRLTVSQYKREVEQVECVFCLCDIEEGEEIRELRCRHLFHRSCLESWLEFEWATCPLCRDSLVPFEVKAKLAEMDSEDIDDSVLALVAYVHNGWWVW